MLGKVAQQTEARNYPKACAVYVADGWSERLRSYLGRSDGYIVKMKFRTGNLYSDVQLNHQKSADVIVPPKGGKD